MGCFTCKKISFFLISLRKILSKGVRVPSFYLRDEAERETAAVAMPPPLSSTRCAFLLRRNGHHAMPTASPKLLERCIMHHAPRRRGKHFSTSTNHSLSLHTPPIMINNMSKKVMSFCFSLHIRHSPSV